jgi:hypothetical protein
MSAPSLDITLAALPDGRFQITARTGAEDELSAVARNPFTGGEAERYLEILSRHKHSAMPLESAKAARQFGHKLFKFLISDHLPVHAAYLDSVEAGLRLRLSLTRAGSLAFLPWELLREPGRGFLALSEHVSIVRLSFQSDEHPPVPLLLPLRVLVAVAGREAEEPWRNLDTATSELRRNGQLMLERLDYASLEDLRLHMFAEDFHVFHYIGFARLDNHTGQSFLVMRHKGRGFIHAEDVNTELCPESTVRLAVLTPCSGSFRPMCDFGSHLRVPAIATMQFTLSGPASLLFYRVFYEALSRGLTVDTALSQARRAIANGLHNSEWAAPVLFAPSRNGILFRRVSRARAGANKA